MTASEPKHQARRALVTGASGFVGARLIPRLLEDGWQVTVLTRRASGLDRQSWRDQVLIVEGDAADPTALRRAFEGVQVAWYLLHSMGASGDFAARDRELATAFSTAAQEAGVARIVYLGGLHPSGELSEHLASRVEVGRILMDSGVPTAVLQAGVVLGAGSVSFEMLRTLSERLPGAIAPRWVRNRIQPIAVSDLLHFLVAAADLPPELNRTFDIGGADVLTYADMMKRYARARGLGPRIVLTAPVTTARLGARWVGLATAVPTKFAEPLVGSLLHDTVVKENDLIGLVGPPPGGPLGFEDAVLSASEGTDQWRWARTLGGTLAAVTATAIVGGIATTPSAAWFRRLAKPAWQPPSAAFGPVWTLLYADLAVCVALTLADAVDAGEHEEARRLRISFLINLVLNAGWSVMFWRVRNLPLAAIWAAALAASSVELTRRVGRRSPGRTTVLAPYPLWCTFATLLTTDLARRNRRQ